MIVHFFCTAFVIGRPKKNFMYLFISLKAVPGLGSFALIPNTVENKMYSWTKLGLKRKLKSGLRIVCSRCKEDRSSDYGGDQLK
jgi:hypothetical protein